MHKNKNKRDNFFIFKCFPCHWTTFKRI